MIERGTLGTTEHATLLRAATAGLWHALGLCGSLTVWRVALTFVSGWTTLMGMMLLYDVFGSDHGGGSIGLLRFVIPISMAGAIHAAIFWALDRWVTMRRRHYFWVIALPLQLLAVGASYGTHWTHMRGASETVGEYLGAQTAIIRSIRTFVQSYQSMAAATAALADHSEKQAKIEADSGTSCGTHAGVGRGPRYNLRMTDRATFASFNAEVTRRRKALEELVERAEKATAATATDAMDRLADLRRLVNEAKTYENDPLLQQLKRTAEQRVQTGKGTIGIPDSKRGKASATSFTCPDAILDQLLNVVVESIARLKPIPEANVKDARDPRIGFSLALRRLAGSLLGLRFLSPSRAELRETRRDELAGRAKSQDGIQSEDIAPLIVAMVIEAALALLFRIGGGSLPQHPGVTELNELIRRRAQEAVFETLWTSLGGSPDRKVFHKLVADHSKFERSDTLIVLPVYSDNAEVQALHKLLLVMTHVGLARVTYTGSYLTRLFAAGWTPSRRTAALKHGVVRIFRMTPVDYLAFMLNATRDGAANAYRAEDYSATIADEERKAA